ncbi:MAG: formate dehydrogenase subunit gamma [Gammaproteobacteria bacterium]|nr:formate dehydrogenase subunit gamma [Gammaproteobacteria bacterium]MDD9894373.1 formate dehydrogenase subunit gamma [Gammaproteobacteria bacterium]MDD9958374.1 formate dehydrogenase subunit gamma [Gammaproteobacteria bacterium]
MSGSREEVVAAIVSKFKETPGPLLVVLHAVQNELGFIPPEIVPVIAAGLNLSRAEVHGVISFYHFFRSAPAGRHTIQICRAESCQAMGSRELEKHARQSLGIEFHQTTADGQITLEPVYCLGNCACSPAIRVGDAIHAHVDSDSFDSIVADLQTEAVEVKS